MRLADFVKPFEGLHDGNPETPLLEPQKDNAGIPTLGWGSIYDLAGKRVTMQTPGITMAEAEALLVRDVALAEANAIRLCLPAVPPALWRVALADFVYNLGAGRLQGSTLRACVRRADYDQAALELGKWTYAGGKKARGLIIRRQVERELATGKLPATADAAIARRALLVATLRP